MQANEYRCSGCGAELPLDAPQGLCPLCLLAGVIADLDASRETQAEEADQARNPCIMPGASGAVHSSLTASLDPLTRFGDYELIEEVARGGMGVVYRARHAGLGRVVALKMILEERLRSPEGLARFHAEARAAANLQHPNIVAVHDVGAHEGRHYFTMDFVAGRSLAELVRESPLSSQRAARYVQRIAAAIHHAHEQGTLHRDLKPSNVLIDANDEPRITDFGLAKRLESDAHLTLSGAAIGTPSYMPPEQAQGRHQQIGPASDVYSLGAMLYELVAGRPPFQADTPVATLGQVLEVEPVSPRLLNPGVPRDLETICLKCLEKEPGNRFASARELADELNRFLQAQPIRSRPIGSVGRLRRWCRRNPLLAAAGASVGGLILVVAIGSLFAVRQINLARQSAVRLAQSESDQRRRAEGTLRRMEFARAEEMFAHDKADAALAILASLLREDRSDRVVTERILNELTHRSFALPSREPMVHESAVFSAEFSPDGLTVLTTARDNSAQVWDATSGGRLHAPWQHQSGLVRSGDFLGPTKPLIAQFSSDGTRVVTGSIDRRARIWKVADGQPVTDWLDHESALTRVQFAPDGATIAAGCADGTLQLWEAATGKSSGRIAAHTKAVNSVEFANDGTRLVTASEDGTARIWNRSGLAPVGSPLLHRDAVRHAIFSPDGERVATGGGFQDPTARVWNSRTGAPLTPLLPHEITLNSVEFSPDGFRLVTASHDRTARIWNVETGQMIGQPLQHGGVVRTAHFSADGQRVVTASEDKTARVWDAHTSEPLTEPLQHQHAVWSARFDPDGTRVVTASSDGTAQVWDTRPGRAASIVLPVLRKVKSVQWSPDGNRLLHTAGSVRVWVPAKAMLLHGGYFHHEGETLFGAFSPDARQLVTTADDGRARIWNTLTQADVTPWMRHEGAIQHASFSPDGHFLATASIDHTARIWDARTGSPLFEPLRHEDIVYTVEFGADGQSVLTASADKTARVWDFRTGRQQTDPLLHRDQVLSARFSPDGCHVLTASLDHTAQIWESASGRAASPPFPHRGAVESARFNSDGTRVVTASRDGTARVWDARTGLPVTDGLAHEAHVLMADFSPDARRVVTASADGTARIWDARTGQALTSPLAHQGPVNFAQFSPDGGWLATASSDWCVRLWKISTADESLAPDWLPQLAEAIAGQRRTTRPGGDAVLPSELLELKRELGDSLNNRPLGEWVRWFFAERAARQISPGFTLTVPDYREIWVKRVKNSNNRVNFAQLRDQLHLTPTNSELNGQLSRLIAVQNSPRFPRPEAEAEFLSQRAAELQRRPVVALRARAEILERQGDLIHALETLDYALIVVLDDPATWSLRARLLEKAGQVEAAYASLNRLALLPDLSRHQKDEFNDLQTQFLSRHPELQRHDPSKGWVLTPEARAAYLRTHRVAPRPPDLPARLIDLTPSFLTGIEWPRPSYLNYAPGFEKSPPNPLRCAGIDFDVRGMIEVGAGWHQSRFPELPTRVKGMAVRQRARRLHFLHTAVGESAAGTVVGRYVLNYEHGVPHEVPLVYGRDVIHWYASLPQDATAPRLAWEGSIGESQVGRLFLSTCVNTRPDEMIESIDLVSDLKNTAIVLLAITLE